MIVQSPLDVLSHQLGLPIMPSGCASPRPTPALPLPPGTIYWPSPGSPLWSLTLQIHARPGLDSNSRPKFVPALGHDPVVGPSPALGPGPHCPASSSWLPPDASVQPRPPSQPLAWPWSRHSLPELFLRSRPLPGTLARLCPGPAPFCLGWTVGQSQPPQPVLTPRRRPWKKCTSGCARSGS